MEDQMKHYSKKLTVSEDHIDELNHVNNVVYLQWVQDIAKEHWFSLAPEKFSKDHFWVVVRHELDYRKQTFLQEEIEVTTYVEEFKGSFSVRCVEFMRGNERLVKAKSKWCLINRTSQKPCRLPVDIANLYV